MKTIKFYYFIVDRSYGCAAPRAPFDANPQNLWASFAVKTMLVETVFSHLQHGLTHPGFNQPYF